MSFYRVLHLSDLHIGETYLPSEELAYKISLDIEQKGFRDIQKVLVTGDIFNGPSGTDTSLIQEAASFFKILMEELNENKSAVLTPKDFLFVPGNHDIVWADTPEKRWAKYRGFLAEFYGDVPDFYDPDDFSFTVSCPNEKLVFLGFNSCGLEKKSSHSEAVKYCEMLNEEVYSFHGIDKRKLLELLETQNQERYEDFGEIPLQQFSKQRRKMEPLEGYQAVALFHHHFFLFPDVARGVADADVIRNHSTVVRNLRFMGVKTILHGHKHFDWERPFIDENYYSTTDSIIDVFAGGSAGFKTLQHHTFSIIDFYSQQEAIKLKQNKFLYREDALDIKSIQIPPAFIQAQAVKLLELLESQDNDSCEEYQKIIMSNLHLHRTCESIITWIGNALMGYAGTYRYLNRDSEYLICLLCAVAGRSISYIGQRNSEEKKNLVETQEKLFEFFAKKINEEQVEKYKVLLGLQNLNQAAKYCNKLLETVKTPQDRRQIAFLMVGMFFTDLNLVLKEYSDDFYRQISHKVNVKLAPSRFHLYVPAARIELQADLDRRSAYVKMWCSDATAHKLAVLFVKEFDLIINRFEDFFKLIDLKLYYLLPKIEKDTMQDTLDNYNFEAYIPTLLPLLIGEKIYHSKIVFARELIQNSIDAISVREAIGEETLSNKEKTIHIELGRDESTRRFFKITDYGTGMDRYKVERYFTSIGRSFYSGDDYDELHISYKPISSFGIGFLSSFMVCQEVDVRTRSFDGEREGLKLHIPNYEGCFFIEREEQAVVGTEIKLYLDDSVSDDKIIQFIFHSIRDIRYDIAITTEKKILLPAHWIRQNKVPEAIPFFVPFFENGTVEHPDWERDVLSGKIINDAEYGLLVYMIPARNNQKKGDVVVLNSGIYTDNQSISALFGGKIERFLSMSLDDLPYQSAGTFNHFMFNFPSNWIQLDVSREKIVSYSDWLKNQFSENEVQQHICCEIAQVLGEQVESYLHFVLENNSNMPAICLNEMLRFIALLSPQANITDLVDRYSLQILFTESGICYKIFNSLEKKPLDMADQSEEAESSALEAYSKLILNYGKHLQTDITVRAIRQNFSVSLFNHLLDSKLDERPLRLKLHQNISDEEYASLQKKELAVLAQCTLIDRCNPKITREQRTKLERILKSGILNRVNVKEAECGTGEISITYKDIMIPFFS